MCEFVEVVLTVEAQKQLSKEWYRDEDFSEHEILEPSDVEPNESNAPIFDLIPTSGFYSVNRDMTDEEMDLYL